MLKKSKALQKKNNAQSNLLKGEKMVGKQIVFDRLEDPQQR